MSDWPIVRMDELNSNAKGSIAIGPFGSRMKSDCYVPSGIPVIRGTNITSGPNFKGEFVYITEQKANELGSANVYQDDLVFPHRGAIGEVGIVLEDKRYVISSSLMKLTCEREKANPKFVYYFFRSKIGRHELLKNASQVGTPGIGQPLTSLRGIELQLPPITIQDQIEEVLTSLDDKIELNRQINQTLEQIAQGIFKSWFVNFEPVKAKQHIRALGGNDEQTERAAQAVIAGAVNLNVITTATDLSALNWQLTQALSEKLAHQIDAQREQLATTSVLFTDKLRDSELGEIPESWEATNFGEVSVCFDSQRIPLSKRQREERQGIIPYYGATSIMDFVDDYLFDGVYLLLGEDGSVLHEDGTPFVQYIWGKSWVNNHAHVLQGRNGISTEHLMVFIANHNISAYVTGAVQLKLNQKNMKSIPFIKAPNELSKKFQLLIEPLYSGYRSRTDESESLRSIRDSLLPKLLSGEVVPGDTLQITAEIV